MRSRWLFGPPERRSAPAVEREAEDFDRADGIRQKAEFGGVGRKPGAVGPLGGKEIHGLRVLGERDRGEERPRQHEGERQETGGERATQGNSSSMSRGRRGPSPKAPTFPAGREQ